VNRIGPFQPTTAGGLAATAEVLRRAPTAVFAYNDLLAIGLLAGLAAAGVRVPDELSVVGFDDIFCAEFCSPPLTTVAAPLREMGAEAFLELHRQMQGMPMRPHPVVSVPTRLVVRRSTANPGRTEEYRGANDP
jgi:DNA-binding LacI/PurR family transcriptional regulator